MRLEKKIRFSKGACSSFVDRNKDSRVSYKIKTHRPNVLNDDGY